MVMTMDDLKVLDNFTRQYHFLQMAAGKQWMEDVPRRMEKHNVEPLMLWMEGFRPGDKHSEQQRQNNAQKQNGAQKQSNAQSAQQKQANAQQSAMSSLGDIEGFSTSIISAGRAGCSTRGLAFCSCVSIGSAIFISCFCCLD